MVYLEILLAFPQPVLDTWNCFSSNYFIIISSIFAFCLNEQTFPKLLVSSSQIGMLPTPYFLSQSSLWNAYCFAILLVHFFVCCALSELQILQLLHNFKQHIVNKFYFKFKHSTQQSTVCCLKSGVHGLQCSLPYFHNWCVIFVHILSNVCISSLYRTSTSYFGKYRSITIL